MSKHHFKKLNVFQLVGIWIAAVLIGLTVFLFLLGELSHYFYLKELGHANLLKPFFSRSLKNTLISGALLLFKYWKLLYQPRILVIIALVISFPFVRRFVRRRMSHRVQKRPILKKLYHFAPWIRAIILTWLIAHYILYDTSKQIGERIAQDNIVLWNQYIDHCINGGAAQVQTLTIANKSYRCAYIIAVKDQMVLFFADKKLHIFDLNKKYEISVWNIKEMYLNLSSGTSITRRPVALTTGTREK